MAHRMASDTPYEFSRQGLRWFTGEFLVVVSGVLVVLALNASYQARVEAERETGYLEQLAADLEESETALQQAVSAGEAQRDRVMALLALLHAEEVPGQERFDELTTLSIAPAQPTLSTAQAIVETGDLHLIRDDALRAAIVQYVGAGESYREVEDAIAWEWLTPSIRDFYEIVRPGLRGHPFAVSPAEALEQPALYDIAFDLQLGYSNHIRMQSRMLAGVQRIRDEVDRVLNQ
jgi:hypothetical protein